MPPPGSYISGPAPDGSSGYFKEGIYALKSKSSSIYLNGGTSPGGYAIMRPGNPLQDPQLHWVIRHCDQGYYSLFSISGRGYLDGRNKEILECCVTDRQPQGDIYLNWEIGQADGFTTLKCKSNGHYLDGRAVDGHVAYATGRSP